MNQYKLSNEQQQYLSRLLAEIPYPTKGEVATIAQNLLLLPLEQVKEAVIQEVQKQAQAKAWAKQRALRKYVVLYEPLPKDSQPEIVWEGPRGEVMKRPVTKQAVTIHVKNLDAYCKEHRLNKEKLMQVALGEVPSYAGYSRANTFCDPANPMCLGKPYQSPIPEKKTTLHPDPSYKPPVQWTPAPTKHPVVYSPSSD